MQRKAAARADKVSKRDFMSADVKLTAQGLFFPLKAPIAGHFRLYFTVSMELVLLQCEALLNKSNF
ncbi:hypothetical protein [Candidatus Sodalis pierantonius]|uniref:hypothetical protein n=1 Tax=Candidatus Sodalis pierantonii TaxID=1486991 RepID=UPI00046CE125|nr:hypothetical protein [Candidatus Sodalis pierantonius]